MIELQQTSSLESILPRRDLTLPPCTELAALGGERTSYQLAYRADESFPCSVSVESGIGDFLSVYRIGNVPVMRTVHKKNALEDDNYISTDPGMYPDVLYPLGKEETVRTQYFWQGIWIEISPSVPVGIHKIRVSLIGNGERADAEMILRVLPIPLPEGDLIYYLAVHADCLASYYGVEALSEAHWERMAQFIRISVKYGSNMLPVPLFTPPLDTQVGGERLTVQLVKIEKKGDCYAFDFSDFEKFIALCLDCGIKYFSIPPFFTQWGAEYAPKFVVSENGVLKKMFGWSTASTDRAYLDFLQQLLPALLACIKRLGIDRAVYFTISDEPFDDGAIARYTTLSAFLKPYLEGFRVFDAFTDPEKFRASGATVPLIPTDLFEKFEGQAEEPYVYYCCAQDVQVSNRFIAMPSYRNRSIGYQLYRYGVRGFFHWALNFYNAQLSVRTLDPFTETDAGGGFPAGDAFSVYPGKDGPIPSVRLLVFFEALQDLRLLKLLEAHVGKAAVLSLIEEILGEVTFKSCAKSAAPILRLRARVIEELQRHYTPQR